MQKIVDTENSDLFDVLAYVAYTVPPQTRVVRANMARTEITTHFNEKQRAFLEFVLSQYVNFGVDELDLDKFKPLLRLRYKNSIADAVDDLGEPEDIATIFSDFQKYLYQPVGST